MQQLGYSLVDSQGGEVQVFGHTPGQCAALPDVIILPNGDRVFGAAVGLVEDYQLVPRMYVAGTPESILFDGTQVIVTHPAEIPESISDRQFAHALKNAGVITFAEAMAFVQTGTIPAALASVVSAIGDQEQREAAELLLAGATEFRRSHPMTEILRVAMGWTTEQTDNIWRDGSLL